MNDRRLIFRLPATSLLAVFFVALCVSPAAFALPWLLALYLIPIGLAWWLLRTRTVADHERIIVSTMFGSRTLSWTETKSLRLTKKSWVKAVLENGEEVSLPGVRPRHLALLASVSDGRLPDPTAEEDSKE